ncbi:hypothetical protein M8J76_009950 [Diaphorina citri]|nr:hypothetical protein M8J76_009950 [Diaphorina citri]
MISLSISENCSFNLMFQKACDNDGDTPKYVGMQCPTEKEAQKITGENNIYKHMLSSFSVSLVMLYAGAWSDSHGKRRRPLVFIPLLGQIITDLGNMICSYFWRTSSLAVSLINGFFPGVSGGRLLLFTGANAYVSDTTNHKDRTFRLGFVASLYCIATPVGDALSGILTVKLGFINVFFLCVAINTIALVIGLYCIRDTSEKYDPRDVEGFCDQMWGNVKVAIRKRPSTSRKIILLALLASPLVRSPILGEQSVLYLFVRYKFDWTETLYGYYAAFQLIGLFIGIIFSLGFLSKKLGVADSKIALVASLMDMTSATLYLMVQSSWQMFVVPMVDIFHGAVQSICTSLLTKHVESHELGKITSVKAFLESIAPSVATPLYNFVYIHTFEYLPSGYYIISICIGLPIFLIFWSIRSAEAQFILDKENLENAAAKEESKNAQNEVSQ